MPDIYMDVDAALSEVPVNIMPLVDDTDFKTIEGAVAYDAGGMALRWHFVTSAGAYTVTSVTPTTGGDYDWTDQGDSGIYTIEIPASGGASINNDTEGYGWFTGVATGILPWRGPCIGLRAAGLNDKLCDSAYDTTRGLAGTALPGAVAEAAGGLATSTGGSTGIDDLATAANLATVDTVVDGIQTDLDNGTDGLGALKTLIDAVNTDLGNGTDGLGALKTLIDTIDTVVDAIKVVTDKMVFTTANQLDAQVLSMATDSLTADAAAADFIGASEIAASASQEIADLIAQDWIAGDASPVAVAAAVWAAATRTLTANTNLNDLDAAGIRSAVGLASADLDTQLGTLAVADTMEGFFQIALRSDAAITTDRAAILTLINANEGSGSGDYAATTESQEAIKDNTATAAALASLVTTVGVAGAGLTAINLPNQTMDITGNITGNLSGSAGSVTGAVGSVTGAVGSVTAAVTVGTINDGAIGADAVADIFSTTTIAEAYAADGAAGTPAQLLYLIQQAITEFAISSTTKTIKKLDGSTTAATETLDDATSPTSITRAT